MEKPPEQKIAADKIRKDKTPQNEPKVLKQPRDLEIPKENNPYFQHLKIPHLEDAKTGLFEQGKVNIILHPFYEMLLQSPLSFDPVLWNNIKNNPQKYDPNKPPGIIYCEQWIIGELNKTLKESDETGLSQRYWRVLEMVQEYQALIARHDSPETYLYVLPKYHEFKENNRNPAIYEVLIDIVNYSATKSSSFIESAQWSNGAVQGSDATLMEAYMPKNTTLTIAGGYIGKCMENLFDTISKGQKNNNWQINVDVTNSTPVLFFDSPDPNFHPGLMTGLAPQHEPHYKAGQQFSNIEEVLSFVNQNSALNRYIIEKTKEHLTTHQDEQDDVKYQ